MSYLLVKSAHSLGTRKSLDTISSFMHGCVAIMLPLSSIELMYTSWAQPSHVATHHPIYILLMPQPKESYDCCDK